LFRGLAALLVCVGHIRLAFWVSYGEVQSKAWWHVPAYLFTSFGHQAVIIFFVLSGFLVGGGLLARGKDFSWTDYLPARLVRLWLVLLPALLFTAACDFLTLRALPNAFDAMPISSLWNAGPASIEGFGWRAFVANGLFLQTIAAPVFGSNTPLWSLAYEFWYYMLFPLIACSLNIVGTSGFLKRGMMLLLAMGITLWLPREIASYFPIWLMGVACFLVIQKYPPTVNTRLTVLSVVLFLCSLAVAKTLPKEDQFWADLLVGHCFSILVICVNHYQVPWRSHGLLGVAIKRMSDFSYSLYLFHFPLVILLAVIILGATQIQPNLAWIASFVGVTGLCLAVAWTSWFLFERHNDYLRGAVRRRMHRLVLLRVVTYRGRGGSHG